MAKKQGKLNIQQLLDKVTLDELRYFVFKQAEEDKKFKDKVLLHFAEKDPALDVSKKFRVMVKAAIRSHTSRGFMDYNQTRRFYKEMEPILNNLGETIQKGNHVLALDSIIALLEEVMPLLPNSDDSSAYVSGILERGGAYLQALLMLPNIELNVVQQFFTWSETALLHKVWFSYGDTGIHLLQLMSIAGLKLPPPSFLGFLDRLYNVHKDERYPFMTNRIIVYKINFLERIGQFEAAAKLVRENLAIYEVRSILVNQVLEKEDYALAKKLIEDGIVQARTDQHPGTVTRWEEKLLGIARLEGDTDTIRHFTKKFAFDRGLSPKYYEEWKETFVLSDWPAVLEDLINKIIEEENEKAKVNRWGTAESGIYRRLAPIFIQEEQWKRLFDLVPADISFENLLYIHKYLAPRFPEEMLAKYLPLLAEEMEKASDRNRYKRIAEWMLLIKNDIPIAKIPVDELAKRMILKYTRRPAMIDEMNQVLSKG